uniref:Uncharacterized protein n=1 Tax=Acrobeloides nanus TaxID=290746 RepID=A0A914DZL0_9BILA
MNKKFEHSKFILGEEINMETNVATINELDYELSRLLNQPTISKLSKIRKSTNVNSFKDTKRIESIKPQHNIPKGRLIALKTTIIRHYVPLNKTSDGGIRITQSKSSGPSCKNPPMSKKDVQSKQQNVLPESEASGNWRSNHIRKAAMKSSQF